MTSPTDKRCFVVIRDGEQRWQVVTQFLRCQPGYQTLRAAKEPWKAGGLTREQANGLARRLNLWVKAHE